MILAVGAADIVGGMFHLLSHAFFKSLLFLSAGCVIQALDEEHNIFKMGNLHRLRPMLSYIFLAGALCLSAFPLLGGYFSKDRILLATFIYPDFSYKILWFIALAAAFLTPLYTFRGYFLIFTARPGGRTADEVRPLPGLMVWILWPLAILTLFDGLLNLPGGIGKNFLGHYLEAVPGARPELGASLALGVDHGDPQRLHGPGVLAAGLSSSMCAVRPRSLCGRASMSSCSPASIWTGCIR